MADARELKTAKIIVDYSTKIKKGDVVQISSDLDAKSLVMEIYKLVLKKGAYPIMHLGLPDKAYWYYKLASDAQLKKFPEIAMHEIKNTDVAIYIGSPENVKELAGINPKRIALRQKVLEPIHSHRVENTRWAIFYYPNQSLAQEAGMSLPEFQDFVFKATNVDWKKERKKMGKLKNIIDKGKQVRIVAENTDLSFSIAGRKGIICSGEFNLPDGEVFTAPVENSVNGHISFTFPAIYGGNEVEGIELTFKNGKVAKAKAEKNEKFLKAMLDTDKGSRTLGEFGIGTNYNINQFVKSILFDEKIGGTIHLALGSTYKETGGKNKSGIHWDIITDLKKGGELYVDGKLIQKNGKFVF